MGFYSRTDHETAAPGRPRPEWIDPRTLCQPEFMFSRDTRPIVPALVDVVVGSFLPVSRTMLQAHEAILRGFQIHLDLDGKFNPNYGSLVPAGITVPTWITRFRNYAQKVMLSGESLARIVYCEEPQVQEDLAAGRIEMVQMVYNGTADVDRDTTAYLADGSFAAGNEESQPWFLVSDRCIRILLGQEADASGKKKVSLRTLAFLIIDGHMLKANAYYAAYGGSPSSGGKPFTKTDYIRSTGIIPGDVMDKLEGVMNQISGQRYREMLQGFNALFAPVFRAFASIEKFMLTFAELQAITVTLFKIEAAIGAAVLAAAATPAVAGALAGVVGEGAATTAAASGLTNMATGVLTGQGSDPESILSSVLTAGAGDLLGQPLTLTSGIKGLGDVIGVENVIPSVQAEGLTSELKEPDFSFLNSNSSGGDSMFGFNLPGVDLSINTDALTSAVSSVVPEISLSSLFGDDAASIVSTVGDVVSVSPSPAPAPVSVPAASSPLPTVAKAGIPLALVAGAAFLFFFVKE